MKKRILHVDDSQVVLHMISSELTKHGYEIISEIDPTKALDRLQEFDIQVCILDIKMPKLNGIQLLEQIKQCSASTQAIILTGEVSQLTLLESYRLGAEYCFYKPVDTFKPLLEALETCFQRVEHWDQLLQSDVTVVK